MSKISEKILQKRFYERNHQRYEFLVPNIHFCDQGGEMDIFCLRPSGFIDEIEIKLSVSDFKADFKKTSMIEDKNRVKEWPKYKTILKHDALRQGFNDCNYFSFLMPIEIVEKCVIPEHAGLYVFEKYENGHSTIRELRRPPRLHNRKISDELKYRAAKNGATKYWYMAGAFKI